MLKKRKILVTSALPYANGEIHLGHLVGYIQADVWHRFQRSRGHDCYFICADDAHGTAIMLKAREDNIDVTTLIDNVNKEHQEDFKSFLVEFDHYYSTHSEENRELCEQIYLKLKQNGQIIEKTITQAYDQKEKLFLADRYIKGDCPNCNESNQYGDNCEACGAVYSAEELHNPYSVISGTTPITKESKHHFFCLQNFTEFLRSWVHSGVVVTSVANKLNEWIDAGLKNWDISRDAPYFGFKIPRSENKYFYVWLDAPIGYMASFKNFCQKKNIDFDQFWLQKKDEKETQPQTELHHFIGKDIINFHALFWPAVLKQAGYRLPTKISVNGFLTINGEKMSKSRGTFINAKQFLQLGINPETLRYYFCSKLGCNAEDIDLNLADFVQKTNSDLVGKVINIASRTQGFIHKLNNGLLGNDINNHQLWLDTKQQVEHIMQLYEQREYAKAIRAIILIADSANEYISQLQPWKLAKIDSQKTLTIQVCTLSLNLFRLIIVLLSPILPNMNQSVESFLGCKNSLSLPLKLLLNCKIQEFTPLLQRLEIDKIEQLIVD